MKYKITGFITAAVFLIFFAACGGGGGNSSNPSNPSKPPAVNISVAARVNARVGEPTIIPVTISSNAVLSVSPRNAAGCDKLGNNSIRCTPTAAGEYPVTLTATLDAVQKTAALTVVVPDIIEVESGNELELFADDTESNEIIFYAASDWTAGIKDGAGQAPDWIGLSFASGHVAAYVSDGETEDLADTVTIQAEDDLAATINGSAGTNYITVILEANYTGAPRTATITIALTRNSEQKETITVRQLPVTEEGDVLGETVTISISPSEAHATPDEQRTFRVTVSKADFTFAVSPIDGIECIRSAVNTIVCTPTEEGTYLITVTTETDKTDTATLIVSGTGTPPTPPPTPPTPPPTPPSDGITLEEFREKYMTYTENIPKVYFDTGGVQVVDKKTWVSATVRIESNIAEYNLTGWQVELRGRGNSSWSLGMQPESRGGGKKPYRLRSKKNDIKPIMGRPAVRNWAFIPVQHDKSLMRNYLAYMLGRSLEGMDYNPNNIYAELYFNGAYQGLYCITDNKDLDTGRTDVGKPVYNAGKLVDIGFYVEIDERATYPEEGMKEGVDYFRITDNRARPSDTKTSNYVLEYPTRDDFDTDEQFQEAFDFVKDYVTRVTDAIYGNNRQKFLELCDEKSFIDYFTVMELFKNPDAKFLSLYFTRKSGGKFKMGHLWDLDLAAGNTTILHWNGGWGGPNNSVWDPQADVKPQRWLVARINPWFRALMERDPVFKQNFAARYKELYAGQIGMMLDCIDVVANNIRPAADRNFNRWNVLNMAIPPFEPQQITAVKTFSGQVDYLKNFLTTRAQWLYDNVDKPMW